MLAKSKNGLSVINWVSYDACFWSRREITEVDWNNKSSGLCLKALVRVPDTNLISRFPFLTINWFLITGLPLKTYHWES